MPRQFPEPLPQQWPYQEPINIVAQELQNYQIVQQELNQQVQAVPNMPAQDGLQPARRENREFTPDLWNEVQTLILELSNLKKKLIEKGVI